MNSIQEIVKKRIEDSLQNDKKQLEVVFSISNRILVEAPAGYGKTKTMVSKIAYMVATKQIPSPKKMLALTFSVNAAYKIKKDVNLQLPILLDGIGIDFNPSDKIFVSNYHGFSRSVLKKYGWLFHDSLKNIDRLQSIDDNNVRTNQENIKGISYDDAFFLSEYSDALKGSNFNFLKENFDRYCDIIIKEMLPQGMISYNAILALTIKLFNAHPTVLCFYQAYFTTILVDEFQDTNVLSYWIVYKLITDITKVILLGDSLQRIYGFIGAVPNLLDSAEKAFKLHKIQLSKNYRFATNQQMLQLDNNIRRNAENPKAPTILSNAEISYNIYDDQQTEALEVVRLTVKTIQSNPSSKVAILVKQRGVNIEAIINTFEYNNIPYFYGLFTDEDPKYLQFHRKSISAFIELIKSNNVTKKLASNHVSKMEEFYCGENDAVYSALLKLLEIFWNKIFLDYQAFSQEEKIVLIKDTFENNGLKQYIEFIDSHIIISTVHAAKGLEWDFVIIPDFEQDSFPNWVGQLCNKGGCAYKSNCDLVITANNEKQFLEELSVFYVAITRARKQVYFTASRHDGRGYSKNASCFTKLPGILLSPHIA